VSRETPMYGRREARGGGLWSGDGQTVPYSGESYYGRPALKPSHYRWLITGYLFAGGLAGASQIIATVADLVGRRGDRGVVRAGRYVALLGALVSPIFLILDLHTPKRWYNMMRIFRSSSPMSIGSWTLAAFGTLSGVAATGQVLEDLTAARVGRWTARLAGIPAAVAGAVMSCYTGSLLSATSVPFWAAVYRLLPPLFGTSAMSTAAAATSLAIDAAGAGEHARRSMEKIALVASTGELALTLACDWEWRRRGAATPLNEHPKVGLAYRFGVLGLGIVVPLFIHAIQTLTGRRSATATRLASISALVGGFIQRAVLTFGGNSSAARAEDYLRFTQPGQEVSGNGRAGQRVLA